ncbi:MAG: N-acetylneuraminate synthase [Myxococcales bacterium FL481]|nr:MAG: N-acetylneuraminate synthase [Myxococcales bacterium FL481]
MSSVSRAPARVVAEIGCNHKGDLNIARDMIRMAAAFCKADAVKLQKRCPKELLTPEQYAAPHPNPTHAYGESYGAHREFLEFDQDQHAELMRTCTDAGIAYSVSVWDLTSAHEMAQLEPEWIKIPSACNLNFALLGWLCENFRGGIHVSLGMTTREEEGSIVEFFEQAGRAQDLVLYACTSGYPVPAEDTCLLEITRLIESYGHRVAQIGFSGHHLGIAADVAAYTLGAEWIERHYTLDRTWRGTDHAASLEPDGVRRLCRDVRAVSKALTHKPVGILEIERAQRTKLKWVAPGSKAA